MKEETIQLHFILPEHASAKTKRRFHYLQKLLSRSHSVNLHLSGLKKDNSGLVAQISFCQESMQPVQEPLPMELSEAEDIRRAVLDFLENPLARSLLPAQQIHAVMGKLTKPVKLQVFSAVCYEVLHLSPETTRGTLNKKRSLYISPKHGIWCTTELGEQLGLQDCR